LVNPGGTDDPLATSAECPPDRQHPGQISASDWVRHTVALLRLAHISTVDQAAKARREEMLAEIEYFIEGFNQPAYRGMRINAVRGSDIGRASGA
jgi:hypothetical protein